MGPLTYGYHSSPLATRIAVKGQLPRLVHPILSAAKVHRLRTTCGEYPTPSIPYDAWGYTPVVYSALAFLLFLFHQEALVFVLLWLS